MSYSDERVLAEVREILAPLGNTYEVIRVLGTGGMGYVVLVKHRVFGLRAMKLIHRSHATSQNLRTRFDREAQVMYTLIHSNVVRVYTLAELNGCPYIEMAYHEGGTVEDHLETFGPLPPHQAVGVAMSVLRGLQKVHDEHIVHRDIKPANILLASDGTPMVTDFGIAHLGNQTMTKVGAKMGTFAYMSPEQWLGQPVDARADVHAVGVMLYVMLTGGPISPTPAPFIETLDANPEWMASVSPVLQRVIRRATAKEIELRIESAQAFITELEACLPQLPEDPPDTPKLGSAPEVKRQRQECVAVEPMGSTAVPSMMDHNPDEDEEAEGSVPALQNLRDRHVMGTVAQADLDDDGVTTTPPLTPVWKRYGWQTLAVGMVIVIGVWAVWRPMTSTVDEQALGATKVVPEVIVPEEIVTAPQPEEAVAEVVSTPEPTKVGTGVVEPAKAKIAPIEPVRAKVENAPPEQNVTINETAQVRLELVGDTQVTVTLSGAGGTHTLKSGAQAIPAGKYEVTANIAGRLTPQTGSIHVTAGITTIRCDTRFTQCKGF